MIWSRLRNVFGSRPAHARRRSDERGMALVGVVFLGMLFTIMGLAVFALSGYEYGQATQRDDSGSAFWFADAAIEHAKAEIFNEITWDAGFDSVSLSGTDEGYYSLAMRDTVFNGDPATWMYARGFIRKPGARFVERDVEVFAKVIPAGFLYALFSTDSINAGGNVDVCGLVHGNDLVDPGGSQLDTPNDSLCENDLVVSDSFEVIPPAVRTEPSFYPATTYYYVVGKPAGPYDRVIILRARTGGSWIVRGGIQADSVGFMLDENGGNARVNYNGGKIEYQFDNTARVNAMFNQTTGACSLGTGDNTVIVNFGEHLQGSAVSWISDLKLGDSNSFPNPVLSTVINTRYIENSNPQDVSIEALTDTDNWIGGKFEFQQIQMTPTNGIALIVHDVDSPGNSLIEIGTDANPALFYATGRIIRFNANGNMSGCTIALGSINMTGGPSFWFNPNFIDNLPDYLMSQFGSSGFAEVLLWREIPPLYSAL